MDAFTESLQHLVGKSRRWQAAVALPVLSEWQMGPDRWQLAEDTFADVPYETDMRTAVADLSALAGKEREKLLLLWVHKRVLKDGSPLQDHPAEAVSIPEWDGRIRSEAKIKAKRGLIQDKILLAFGVLCEGKAGSVISSGDVKRYIRNILKINELADDATTFLLKLAESGDLKLRPERLSRNETVFELTESGSEAIDELLL